MKLVETLAEDTPAATVVSCRVVPLASSRLRRQLLLSCLSLTSVVSTTTFTFVAPVAKTVSSRHFSSAALTATAVPSLWRQLECRLVSGIPALSLYVLYLKQDIGERELKEENGTGGITDDRG